MKLAGWFCALMLAVALPVAAKPRANIFASTKSWAFQLKNINAAQLAASPYDMVVIDSELFETGADRPLRRDEVEAMQKKPDGSRRLVIA